MSAEDAATIEKNKARIAELYERIDQETKDAFLEEFVTQTSRNHNPFSIFERRQGLDGFRQVFTSLLALTPDRDHTIDDIIAAGDRVVVRVSATGTVWGFLGVPSKQVRMTGIVIYRMEDGKIAEKWSERNFKPLKPAKSGEQSVPASVEGIEDRLPANGRREEADNRPPDLKQLVPMVVELGPRLFLCALLRLLWSDQRARWQEVRERRGRD